MSVVVQRTAQAGLPERETVLHLLDELDASFSRERHS